MSDALLEIRKLSLQFHTYQGVVRALEEVDLTLGHSEILGLVGESGCGKSVMARSVLRLNPEPPARVSQGEILFKGQDLLTLQPRGLREIRGRDISMIFQEPMSSLNPVYTIGNQMQEVITLHQRVSTAAARGIAVDMLRQVNMPDPEQCLAKYPHELSGGMRQRVMIAMELSCKPDLLIADEPTTALDVTVQGQVLTILADVARRMGTSVLFISHDLGVVAQLCDRVSVMYAGRIVETGPVERIFANPLHPYTKGLLRAVPSLEEDKKALQVIPGNVPRLIDPPSGCRFHPRCPSRFGPCDRVVPGLTEVEANHHVACHLYGT
ncbi:MAG TPA: ABC transporter ATP-binding protein [Spirochaetia bacterium]|nr:ABC transporter ATP-binding protein [Spirochaetia bacterium]